MNKVLTLIFKDVEEISDVSIRSIPNNKDHVVLITDGGSVVVHIQYLQDALNEIRGFNEKV